MAGSARIPSSPVDEIINSFEISTSWSFTPQAKNIIRDAFDSINIDIYGLVPDLNNFGREEIYQRALEKLPDFLELLTEQAEDQARRRAAPITKNWRTVGGILVVQNFDIWKNYLKCICWPRD